MSLDTEAFSSAPIKLAAMIKERRAPQAPRRQDQQANLGTKTRRGRRRRGSRSIKTMTTTTPTTDKQQQVCSTTMCYYSRHCSTTTTTATTTTKKPRFLSLAFTLGVGLIVAVSLLASVECSFRGLSSNQQLVPKPNNQLESNSDELGPSKASSNLNAVPAELSMLRHHAHYLNIIPSTHFSYNEGRQANGRSMSSMGSDSNNNDQLDLQTSSSSHIYKRSSAALVAPPPASQTSGNHHHHHHYQNAPLVSSSRANTLNPLSRRMMSNWAQTDSAPAQVTQRHLNQWFLGQGEAGEQQQATGDHLRDPEETAVNRNQLAPVAGKFPSMASGGQANAEQQQHANSARNNDKLASNSADYDAELLKQKQHIQYHDQWPSLAGKCHKRTLNFCASVLPFNTTTFPNIIGDTNRFEVKRSLPFFGFLAKSSCNRRLDELLCLLLEPPCQAHSGLAIPPCKKFCRLALEGCNEYIPATLALSSVFDCRQYPDSNDPGVCVNLAQGSKCSHDEFKCPDKTCIPRNWLCDGVRDCVFAADEANCTATPQASVCSTEEFKCDGKCVPKAWKCDGERDCLDGSDEESCDLKPRCGPDRFKCSDGNGCIPKRWVCDGKAECRDGSDEMNCDQRECSENDFKCDNGICIPKLWRCDRQFDCKDGSDERQCVYPTPAPVTTTSTTTTQTPTTTTTTTSTTTTSTGQSIAEATSEDQQSVETTVADKLISLNATYGIQQSSEHEQAGGDSASSSPAVVVVADDSAATNYSNAAANYYSTASGSVGLASEPQQQLGSNLVNDVSRIIQHESSASSKQRDPLKEVATGQTNKPDYEIIQSNGQQQTNELQQAAAGPNQVPPSQLEGENARQHQQAPPTTNKGAPSVEYVLAQQRQPQQQLATGEQSHQAHQSAQQTVPQQQLLMPTETRQQQARVPIYRSLFKNFKTNHQRQQPRAIGGPAVGPNGLVGPINGARGNVVAVARRRRNDRNPLVYQQQQQQPHQFAQQQQQQQPQRPQPSESGESVRQQQQQQLGNLRDSQNGVTSYLQMLNNRYNLRLAPRVGQNGVAQSGSGGGSK